MADSHGSPTPRPRFWRGMLHAHSCWSDGRALPEQAFAAYRDAGYDFFALTDHNRVGADPDRWLEVAPPVPGIWPPRSIEPSVFEAYKAAFPDMAKWRVRGGKTEVRASTVAECLARFDQPGGFLAMSGFEVTTAIRGADGARRDLHMNCIGLAEPIPRVRSAGLVEWIEGSTPEAVLRETKDEADALAAHCGNPPHLFFLNHPYWQYYDISPEDLIANPDVRFFEVCNSGSEWVAAAGMPRDGYDNDRFWDAVNAARCLRGEPLLYGLGSEDTHWYPGSGTTHTPLVFGDAWIGVRAETLAPAAIFGAMERGDFYAAGGFDLEDVHFDVATGTLSVAVPAKPGTAYNVKFITTKRGVDVRPVRGVDIPAAPPRPERHVPVYSDEVGAVAKAAVFGKGEAVRASYTMDSDDLYVRARVESDEPSVFPEPEKHLHPPVKTAWTQPYRRA